MFGRTDDDSSLLASATVERPVAFFSVLFIFVRLTSEYFSNNAQCMVLEESGGRNRGVVVLVVGVVEGAKRDVQKSYV